MAVGEASTERLRAGIRVQKFHLKKKGRAFRWLYLYQGFNDKHYVCWARKPPPPASDNVIQRQKVLRSLSVGVCIEATLRGVSDGLGWPILLNIRRTVQCHDADFENYITLLRCKYPPKNKTRNPVLFAP